MIGVFRTKLCKAVVAEPRPFGGIPRSRQPIERRHAEAYHLAVVWKALDHALALVDVVKRRDTAHALAEILLTGGRRQQQLVDALRKEMIEGIDIAHSHISLGATFVMAGHSR